MLIFTKSCKFSRSFQALVQVRQNTTLWPCGMFFCYDQRWGNKKNAQVRQPLHSALREWEKCQLWKLWCFGKTFRLQTISMDWWSMADIVHNVFNISVSIFFLKSSVKGFIDDCLVSLFISKSRYLILALPPSLCIVTFLLTLAKNWSYCGNKSTGILSIKNLLSRACRNHLIPAAH